MILKGIELSLYKLIYIHFDEIKISILQEIPAIVYLLL